MWVIKVTGFIAWTVFIWYLAARRRVAVERELHALKQSAITGAERTAGDVMKKFEGKATG